MWASNIGNEACVGMLLEAGADTEPRDLVRLRSPRPECAQGCCLIAVVVRAPPAACLGSQDGKTAAEQGRNCTNTIRALIKGSAPAGVRMVRRNCSLRTFAKVRMSLSCTLLVITQAAWADLERRAAALAAWMTVDAEIQLGVNPPASGICFRGYVFDLAFKKTALYPL